MENPNNSGKPAPDTGSTTWTAWLSARGFAGLFGIKNGEPHLFDDLDWGPNDADRRASWTIYTELRTRIATQPLRIKDGDEATALDSVYHLFELCRGTISNNEGCLHFATLTTRMLNVHVRPLTAKWHAEKLADRLSSADVRFRFRHELAELQPRMRSFTSLMGLLAHDFEQVASSELEPASPLSPTSSRLWEPTPIACDVDNAETGKQIQSAEAAEILARRRFYGLPNSETPTDGVGLALSGGGIRSATFALGVVQTLARRGVLRDVDYLSTVSGGGYFGAFISSFLNDPTDRVSLRPEARALPFGGVNDEESQGVRHLRNHSKYLTEGGVKVIAVIICQVIYGVIISALLVSPLILSAVLIAALLFGNWFRSPTFASFLPGLGSGLLLATLVAILPVIQTYSRNVRLKDVWVNACVWLAVLTFLLLAVGTVPHLFGIVAGDWVRAITIATFATVCFGAAGIFFGAQRSIGRVAFSLFGLTTPLAGIFAFLFLCQLFITGPRFSGNDHYELWLLALLTLGAWIYASFAININLASPHPYYRNRLARTYLIRDVGGGVNIDKRDPQPLSRMNMGTKAPYHLINAALNIPGCEDPNLRGRASDFFLFSKYFCGSPIIGYSPTIQWEQADENLDLGTAMAISGAAAAPHMGTLTARRFVPLLAMLNVRLGYWAKRPPRDSDRALTSSRPPIGWLYFLRELTGLMSEKSRFINISDGGHIENLGIYELLRRRCKFIIAVDGEADPKRSFGGLLTLAQMASIDLGVEMQPNLADLRINASGWGRGHFALCRIKYRNEDEGLLLYVKTSLTGNEPEVLQKYHAEHPDFPHESTAQQLFNESQFEAYRSLGEHIANDLFRPDLVGTWQPTMRVHDWFERLASQLL